MADASTQLGELRETALRVIGETRVAGRDTRHSRSTNLQAIRGLINGEPHYTFGIKGVDRYAFDEALRAIASITKCSADPTMTTGGGYISPNSTLTGLEAAAARIATVARQGGRFLVATGHPGSSLLFFIELAALIRHWGGQVLEPQRGAPVPPNLDLEYIRGVAVTSDRISLMHTHDYRAGEIMIDGVAQVDLVVADHGYVGAAVNAKIPAVTTMDTNDPGMAVAKRMGADLTIIPLDDNRPLSCYPPIVRLIEQFGNLLVTSTVPLAQPPAAVGTPAPAHPVPPLALPDNARARLRVAERVVARRVGSTAALDELIYSFVDSYRDQFLQAHFPPDEIERTEDDPALDLVIFKRLHDALRTSIIERLQLTNSSLTPAEIVSYLEQPTERPAEPRRAA